MEFLKSLEIAKGDLMGIVKIVILLVVVGVVVEILGARPQAIGELLLVNFAFIIVNSQRVVADRL